MGSLVMTTAAKKAMEKAKEFNLRVTSGYRSPADDKRVGGTGSGDHTRGLALDVAGSVANMDKFAKWAKASGLYRIVLWQVKDHYDHVHVAWTVEGQKGWTEPKDGIVQNGNKGAIVAFIQKLLGVVSDGYYGSQTEAAVKKFQENRKLESDGVVGSKTWNALTNGAGSFFS